MRNHEQYSAESAGFAIAPSSPPPGQPPSVVRTPPSSRAATVSYAPPPPPSPPQPLPRSCRRRPRPVVRPHHGHGIPRPRQPPSVLRTTSPCAPVLPVSHYRLCVHPRPRTRPGQPPSVRFPSSPAPSSPAQPPSVVRTPPSSRPALVSCANPRPRLCRLGGPPSVVQIRRHAFVFPGGHRQLCECRVETRRMQP
jgi:hypothetical protein